MSEWIKNGASPKIRRTAPQLAKELTEALPEMRAYLEAEDVSIAEKHHLLATFIECINWMDAATPPEIVFKV